MLPITLPGRTFLKRNKILSAPRLFSTTPYRAPDISHEYCLNLLRSHDYPQYLVNLLQPSKQIRWSHAAIRAFYVELARIPDLVHGKQEIGALRYAWYKAAIDGAKQGEPVDAPLIRSLAEFFSIGLNHNHNEKKQDKRNHDQDHNHYHNQHKGHHDHYDGHTCNFVHQGQKIGNKISNSSSMTTYWLARALNTRENIDMKGPGKTAPLFKNWDDLETYLESTDSSFIYIHLQALGVYDSTADHIASHLGKASGICRIIRSVPRHAATGVSYIPSDLLKAVKYDAAALYKTIQAHGIITEKQVQDVFFEMGTRANQHLVHARSLASSLAKTKNSFADPRHAFYIAQYVDYFLKLFQKVDFNPFHPLLQRQVAFSLQWSMLKNKYMRRF